MSCYTAPLAIDKIVACKEGLPYPEFILSLIPPVAVVHLKDTVYRVREDAGVVRICIVVTKPNVECPVTFPFDIHFYTSADSAGM